MCLSAGGGENRYQSDWELPPGSEKRQTAEDEGRGSREQSQKYLERTDESFSFQSVVFIIKYYLKTNN